MSLVDKRAKIEFIESYINGTNGSPDYQWSDNHGRLIRCHSCKHRDRCEIAFDFGRNGEFYCANGEPGEDDRE